MSDKIVTIAGRIAKIRPAGKQLRFVDLVSNGNKLQIHANSAHAAGGIEEFHKQHELIRRGDIIGV